MGENDLLDDVRRHGDRSKGISKIVREHGREQFDVGPLSFGARPANLGPIASRLGVLLVGVSLVSLLLGSDLGPLGQGSSYLGDSPIAVGFATRLVRSLPARTGGHATPIAIVDYASTI
jgi:hypothetical protein